MVPSRFKTSWAMLLVGISALHWFAPPVAGAPASAEDAAGEGDKLVQTAQQQVQAMDIVTKRTASELDVVQKSGDDEKLRCVRDKWTAMRGLLKLSSQALIGLRQAQKIGDRGGVNHERTKIEIAAEKMSELEAQVQACGGAGAQESGDGDLVLEKLFDADLPTADPTEEFRLRDVDLSRPMAATQIF